MSNKTRKRIWPVSLVMSIAIVGALAAFLVLAANPGASQAHPGDDAAHQAHCATLGPIDQAIHDNINSPGDVDCADLAPANTAPMAGDAIGDQSVAPGVTTMVESTITDADADDTLTWSVTRPRHRRQRRHDDARPDGRRRQCHVQQHQRQRFC